MQPVKRHFLKINLKGGSRYIVEESGRLKDIIKDKPIPIEIFPSMQCNVNCASCDRGTEESMLEDFNDIQIFYNNLHSDPDFNLLKFCISGGEPTLYPRVNELISFLHGIDPHVEIHFLTNALKIENLTKKSLANITLLVSIYPKTEKILKKNRYIVNLFKTRRFPLTTNTFFHQDMKSYGAIRNDLNPSTSCLNAVLVCGTKRVYPCCRAHRLEQIYRKNYHFYIDTPSLYKKLKGSIKNTDLCTYCPYSYKDGTMIPC